MRPILRDMTIAPYTERALIAIGGEERSHFLQGIVTQDVEKLNAHKILFSALLSPQGKVLHDMFLIAEDNRILIDTQAAYKDILLKRLNMYKLRAKVTIEDVSAQMGVTYDDAGLLDPRHHALPRRRYGPAGAQALPDVTLAIGIPELGRDFEPDQIVAMDAGYDLLNAISFHKGCYVGQEVTARMHYKNIARKGFYLLESDLSPTRLALLRFEEVEAANDAVTVDNQPYRATLPGWMQPKLEQFRHGLKNQ